MNVRISKPNPNPNLVDNKLFAIKRPMCRIQGTPPCLH